jgi:DNA-binding NtrC family response regulator
MKKKGVSDSPSTYESNNNNTSILALDDELDIVTLIERSLQKYGLRVSIFIDPYVALEHFKSNFKDYNIVISDIRMPAMNGYEFVKKVKSIKPQVKIILISAFNIKDNEFLNVLPNIKIDAFIQKPFSISTLRNTVIYKV